MSFHTQSTAMYCTNVAMILCEEALRDWRKKGNWDGFMNIQCHDELIFDLPKRAHPLENRKASNYYLVKELKKLMESTGDRIGIPLVCNVDIHLDNWGKAVTIM